VSSPLDPRHIAPARWSQSRAKIRITCVTLQNRRNYRTQVTESARLPRWARMRCEIYRNGSGEAISLAFGTAATNSRGKIGVLAVGAPWDDTQSPATPSHLILACVSWGRNRARDGLPLRSCGARVRRGDLRRSNPAGASASNRGEQPSACA
jgi:hypothetical protein